MAVKTYALLDSLNATANIFNRIGNERVRVTKMPFWSPYLQITFTDKEGVNRSIRYKQTAKSIYLDEQIEKDKIPANEKYTTRERNAPQFRNGILVTSDLLLQNYLDAYPANDKFEGYSEEKKAFRLVDKEVEARIVNDSFRQRAKAAMFIADISLEEAQSVILRLYGSFYTPPTDLIEAQNILIDFLDNADDKGVEALLKKENTVDEKTTIFIGKLLAEEIISFDSMEGQVAKVSNGKLIAVKEMPVEYSLGEKKRLFAEFLTSNAGKLLYDDLDKDLKAVTSKSKKQVAT